jgi:hypothetical protein
MPCPYDGKWGKAASVVGGFLLLLMLTACGGNPTEVAGVPTTFNLPTLTDSPVPPPTLPATWTLTPTETLTPTPTLTTTLSVTPSATITDTPTPTASPTTTNTPDNEGIFSLALTAQVSTIIPQGLAGTPFSGTTGSGVTPQTASCTILPPGGFGLAFTNNPTLPALLGCPVGNPPTVISTAAAMQNFERGSMLWVQGAPNYIYVLMSDGNFLRFDDTYNAAVDPVSGGEVPPPNMLEPVRGFGKVWRLFVNVRGALGWAITPENGTQATIQVFERGRMMYVPARGDILALSEDVGAISGKWQSIAGSF